jgi:7,8-dihydroneopterin aldolase/epimerase/oxygenase
MTQPSDKIVLGGIEFYGHVGVSAAEREVGQRFVVDIEMITDLATAAASDNIADTINYASVYDTVVAIGQKRTHCLIEPLAEETARALLERFSASEVMVRITKCPPPISGIIAYAGVEIRRKRSRSAG